MVSKVAVVALVLVVACPVLIGYGMSLQETAYTNYEQTGQAVNVTPLLLNGTYYSYAHADIVDMNTKVLQKGLAIPPEFAGISSTKSAIPMTQDKYYNSSIHPNNTHTFSNYYYYSYIANYDPGQGYISASVHTDDGNGNTSDVPITRLYSLYYDFSDNTLYHRDFFLWAGTDWYISSVRSIPDAVSISYSVTGTYLADSCISYINRGLAIPDYVDVSSGFYLNRFAFTDSPDPSDISNLNLPQNPRSILLTLDLRTILDANYSFELGVDDRWITLVKTTTAGLGEQWAAYWNVSGNTSKIADLYYDPSKDYNTYQLYIDNTGIDFRFVGNWPKLIGPANTFITYHADWPDSTEVDLGEIGFKHRTCLIRVDDAEYKAFELPVMNNITYDPVQFKSNPSTTIKDPTMFGSSLTFGGQTYTVTQGNITMGTHQVSLRNMVFDSVPIDGGYDNRINGVVVSHTADPSTITFNGTWLANITTISYEITSGVHTEWLPGQFGWDGIDNNFLTVGLITAIGVFLALGIAYRQTKAALGGLLVVCGGAILLFFTML